MTINDIEPCVLEFMREYMRLPEEDKVLARRLVCALMNKEFVKRYRALPCCNGTAPARDDVKRLLAEWESVNGKSHAQSG